MFKRKHGPVLLYERERCSRLVRCNKTALRMQQRCCTGLPFFILQTFRSQLNLESVNEASDMNQQPVGGTTQPYYSGIEVVPAEQTQQSSPQPYYGESYPIHVETDGTGTPAHNVPAQGSYYDQSAKISTLETPYTHEKTPNSQVETNAVGSGTSGRKKRLWIWIVVGAVVVIAAVAGGVAGGLVSKSSKDDKQSEVGASSG